MVNERHIPEVRTGCRNETLNFENTGSEDMIETLAALPSWARDLVRSKTGYAVPIRGRILKLKLGYNPNSSSVGSGVYVLPVILLGISTLFGAAAGIISSAFAHGRRKQTPRNPEELNRAGTD